MGGAQPPIIDATAQAVNGVSRSEGAPRPDRYDSVDALPTTATEHTPPSPAYSTGYDNGNRMNSGLAKREPDWWGHEQDGVNRASRERGVAPLSRPTHKSFRDVRRCFMPITLREAVRAFEDAPQVDYSLCSHGLPCGRCGSRGEVGCRLFSVRVSMPTTVYRALEAASKCGLFDGNKFFNYGHDNHGPWTLNDGMREVFDDGIPF